MKVLFLTLIEFETLQERNIYTDLLREFVKNGHEVFVVSPVEKRKHIESHLVNEGNATVLRLRIGNIQKSNIIEKGISTMMVEPLFKKAIKKYFSDVKFDFVLYSTPPITLVSAIEYVKNRDGAITYLLLKDIFPQNAVDLGMLSKIGVKGILYNHFRKLEKRLYRISDKIGCMSQANVDYIVKHNSEVDPKKVEICPNSVELVDMSIDTKSIEMLRKKYNLPLKKKIFVYGGNLGKPQGIPFLVECLKECEQLEDAFFLIVGDGTEYNQIYEYVNKSGQKNVKILKRIPKEEYDVMIGACDVGMIFLDYRFTIPNFPSRLLSYMQAKIPILAVTDVNTDIGKTIVDGKFGWWVESNSSQKFRHLISSIIEEDINDLGKNAWKYLCEHYDSKLGYQIIVKSKLEDLK